MFFKKDASRLSRGFTYAELPTGIFTCDGVWFHTTESSLKSFAPQAMEKIGLERLLQDATTWTRVPTALTALLVPALLVSFSPLQSAVFGLMAYVLLVRLTPSVVVPSIIPVARILVHPIVQGLIYVAALSYLARIGAFPHVWTGITAFLILRWGVLDRFLAPWLSGRGPGLDVPDRVLRALITRRSLSAGWHTMELKNMEQDMIRIMNYRKKKS